MGIGNVLLLTGAAQPLHGEKMVSPQI